MFDAESENVESVSEVAKPEVVESVAEVVAEAPKAPKAPKVKAAKKPAKKVEKKVAPKKAPKKTKKAAKVSKPAKAEKKRSPGRPAVYTGALEKYITDTLKKTKSLTYTRIFFNAKTGTKAAEGRNVTLVPKALGISIPTLRKFAERANLEFPKGRPSFASLEKKGKKSKVA